MTPECEPRSAAVADEPPGRAPQTASAHLHRLVRAAILAPSSHNTQPCRFRLDRNRIDLVADPERWLPVADRERRELYLSLGCALENMLIAAEHAGYAHEVELLPEPPTDVREWPPDERVASVRLVDGGSPSPFRPPELYAAIPARRTNRRPSTGRAIGPGAMERLASCVVEEGVQLHLNGDPELRRRASDLVAHADRLELSDPAYRRELAAWIGLGAFGTPWALSRLGQLAVRHLNLGKSQARRDSRLMASSPVVGLFSSSRDDPRTRLRTGQAVERVWLMATHLGLGLQPMSAPLQVPRLRREVAEAFGVPERHPQLLFRLGVPRATRRRAPRRPTEEALMGWGRITPPRGSAPPPDTA